MFKTAVDLATRATTKADKEKAYWDWIGLRLDKPARNILAQAKVQTQSRAQAENPPRDATWPELEESLKILLIDPQEEYKWHTKLMTIKWDGIENFHAFASRVIAAVDKFDKGMDDAYKKREYFLRFRMGLPKVPYQDAIDMNVGFNNHSIELAKEAALRAQLIVMNKGEDTKQVSFASASMPARYGNVSASDQYVAVAPPGDSDPACAPNHSGAPPPNMYGNASMLDSRLDSRCSSMESSLAGITTKLEDIHVSLRSYDSRLGNVEKDVEGLKRSGNSGQGQNPGYWPPQNQGYWYPPNYWPPQGYAGGYTAPYGAPPQVPYSYPQNRPTSPHRQNQQYSSPSRNRTGFSPNRSGQQNSGFPPNQNRGYSPNRSGQQNRTGFSPNRSGQQNRGFSPNQSGQQNNSNQRPASPNRSGQSYFPSPGKSNPSNVHPKYQQPGAQGGQFHFDTGDENSGYESEVDPEVSRLQAELEKAKAKAMAKGKRSN